MKIFCRKFMRAFACMLCLLVAHEAMAQEKAIFRWFEYCPGVERRIQRAAKGKRARIVQISCLTDSFVGEEIDQRWIHLNDPDDENYNITANGLQLTPTYVNLANTHYSPSAIFIEPSEGAFIAACEVAYKPQTPHDFAGMALYADAGSTVIFGRGIVNGHQAVVVRLRRNGDVQTAFQPLQPYELKLPVWLRIKSYDNECSFFYSTNRGTTWIPVANNLPLPGDTLTPGTLEPSVGHRSGVKQNNSQSNAKDESQVPFLLGLYATTNPR